MDFLFVWWGIDWLGQWLFQKYFGSLALTSMWLLIMLVILVWVLNKKNQLPLYGLCFGNMAYLSRHKAVALMLFALPCANLIMIVLEGHSPRELTPDIIYVLAVTVLVAITEEFIFRGLLIRWLKNVVCLPNCAVVLFSAVLFTLAHALNGDRSIYLLCQMLSAITFGICAGALSLHIKSIVPAIIVHSFTNIIGEFVSTSCTLLGIILYIIAAIIYLVLGIYFLKQPVKEGIS